MDATTEQREALSHRETMLIVLGMLLPTFMGSLDQTIMASALPTIGRDLGDVHNLPWLITGYLLASTAILPLYGKIADIHGRRFTLRIALLTYMAGSLVCALAPDMLVLILGRVVHGLGGGGLTAMGMIVLADLVAPKERGRYYTYFALAYTTAGGSGPALGGFIAQHLHWSMIFWLNIAMGLLALAITNVLLRRLPRYERPHRLDVIGTALIVVASVAFMLALSTGGVRWPWTSPQILALLAVALVVGRLFVVRLTTAPEPLVPITILRHPIVRCAMVVTAFGWGTLLALNVVLPIYLQNALGLSPTSAGLYMVVFMVAMNASAALSGQVLGRVRQYKVLPTIGLMVTIAGTVVLALRAGQMTPPLFEITVIAIGLGFGPLPSLTSVVTQNVVARHQIGIAIGSMNFCRNLYGTIMIAAFGAIALTGSGDAPGGSAEAFGHAFLLAVASQSVAFAALVLMEPKPLQTAADLDAGGA
jgi:EmrB/QacA subfamily drug resistance transporter